MRAALLANKAGRPCHDRYGRTLATWQGASRSWSTIFHWPKSIEGHTDALAILAEPTVRIGLKESGRSGPPENSTITRQIPLRSKPEARSTERGLVLRGGTGRFSTDDGLARRDAATDPRALQPCAKPGSALKLSSGMPVDCRPLKVPQSSSNA